MKLIKINPKRFSPKRLFRYKNKTRSDLSNTSSSSSSTHSSFVQKTEPLSFPTGYGTPTSVLPEDWSESDDANSDLFEAFKVILDRDNDGIVSRKELEAILYRVGSDPPTKAEVAAMISEVDGDGFISLEALRGRVGSACAGPPCVSELRETFEFFDVDRDGRITAEELYGAFCSMGDEGCTLDECRRMIADVDENGDGFVCFAEFVRMMEPLR